MLYSQMLIPTVKEVPSDAEIPSHQLMLRAGLMRKLASGTYTYLPAGLKCLQKVMNIVREEMNAAGAQEILMPSVQPMELWERTGRNVAYGETMARFEDRHGHLNVLAPTAEEVVTFVVSNEVSSYKQLPLNVYQISFKFRDEFRPRFGVLRSREFIMKDAYSFHATDESLDKTYWKMYETYKRIFKRCGLEYVIVEAESGEMGGSGSHQFTVPCDNGEDVIVYTEDGSYAANIEKASVDPLPKLMLDGIDIPAQEIHTLKVGSIEAVCEFLKTKPSQMIKTLIYRTEGKFDQAKDFSEYVGKHEGLSDGFKSPTYSPKLYAVLVRGDHEVNPEKLTQLLGGKHVELASEELVVERTGAAVGFAGPTKNGKLICNLIVDYAVANMGAGIAGANKTDFHIKDVVPGRDFPLEGDNVFVGDIRNAVEGDTHDGKKLMFKRGIEVGQVFKLGKKYTEKLECKFLDENSQQQVCTMGCYGIGINRIVASAIENGYDADGIIWPINIAPFEVIITTVGVEEEVTQAAKKIHDELAAADVDVLFDDRDVRGGVKFKDADLLGIPVRVTIGKKNLAEGLVELKLRREKEVEKIPVGQAVEKTVALVKKLKAELEA